MTSHSLFPSSSKIQSRQGRIGQVQIVILLGSIDSKTNQSYSDVRNKRLTRCLWLHNLVLISTNQSSLQRMRMGKILHFLQTYCWWASIFHILEHISHLCKVSGSSYRYPQCQSLQIFSVSKNKTVDFLEQLGLVGLCRILICDSAQTNFTICYTIQQICDFDGYIPVVVFIGVVVNLLSVVVEGRQCRLKMKWVTPDAW